MPVPSSGGNSRKVASRLVGSSGPMPRVTIWPRPTPYALAGKAQSVDLTLARRPTPSSWSWIPRESRSPGLPSSPAGLRRRSSLLLSAPEFILPVLQAVTGADGRVRLPALPYEVFRSVRIATTTLGIQHLLARGASLTGRPPREIRLRSTGRIFGRIVADRPEWTRGVKISITTTRDRDRRDTEGTAEVVSRADGLFLIPAIAAGHARFRITVDPALPVLPRIPDVEVERDAITRVEIRLERTVRVRGAIRSRETGDPVAGAEILIGHGPSKEGARAVSDYPGTLRRQHLARRCDDAGDVHAKLLRPGRRRPLVSAASRASRGRGL